MACVASSSLPLPRSASSGNELSLSRKQPRPPTTLWAQDVNAKIAHYREFIDRLDEPLELTYRRSMMPSTATDSSGTSSSSSTSTSASAVVIDPYQLALILEQRLRDAKAAAEDMGRLLADLRAQEQMKRDILDSMTSRNAVNSGDKIVPKSSLVQRNRKTSPPPPLITQVYAESPAAFNIPTLLHSMPSQISSPNADTNRDAAENVDDEVSNTTLPRRAYTEKIRRKKLLEVSTLMSGGPIPTPETTSKLRKCEDSTANLPLPIALRKQSPRLQQSVPQQFVVGSPPPPSVVIREEGVFPKCKDNGNEELDDSRQEDGKPATTRLRKERKDKEMDGDSCLTPFVALPSQKKRTAPPPVPSRNRTVASPVNTRFVPPAAPPRRDLRVSAKVNVSFNLNDDSEQPGKEKENQAEKDQEPNRYGTVYTSIKKRERKSMPQLSDWQKKDDIKEIVDVLPQQPDPSSPPLRQSFQSPLIGDVSVSMAKKPTSSLRKIEDEKDKENREYKSMSKSTRHNNRLISVVSTRLFKRASSSSARSSKRGEDLNSSSVSPSNNGNNARAQHLSRLQELETILDSLDAILPPPEHVV